MARSIPTGRRIRERRLAQGLRQVAVARDAGISASYLNLIEHGKRAIGGALLGRIAAVLGADHAALSEEGDAALVDAVRAAGAARGADAALLAQAGELARGFPGWARVVSEQAEALAGLARTVEALSDRLGHDPALADAMHELLSTVATIRSTAAILAQTPELDPNWRGRFHANLDEDSRRLAHGVEAVVALFDAQAVRDGGHLLAAERVARFLDAHGHRFDALERLGAAAIPDLVAQIDDAVARDAAARVLAADADDAGRLPRAWVEAATGPDDLTEAAGGDLALVLRRLGIVDPGRGLVICDAAGAMLRRVPVPGFPLPVAGAGCPLWPVYGALTQPGRPLVARIATPDGAVWRAHAIAAPAGPARFGAAPVLRATMLLTRADRARTGDAPDGAPVGPGCRTCPRAGCPARREPSVLSEAAS